MEGGLPQTIEHELLSGTNLGFPHDYPLVLECTPCVRRGGVQRTESPCRCCRSRGDGSQCGRGSPRSRWSEGRPSTMSSSRRTRRRACPLVSMLVRLSVLVGKTETKQERKKKETGDGGGRWNWYSPWSESVGRRGCADIELPTFPVLPCRDRTCLRERRFLILVLSLNRGLY